MRKLLFRIKPFLYQISQLISVRTEIVEGVPAGGNHAVRVLFVGRCWFHEYVKHLFPQRVVRQAGRESIWRIRRRVRCLEDQGIDICFLNAPTILDAVFRKWSGLAFGQAIGQEIPVSDWPAVHSAFSKSRKNLANRFDRGLAGVSWRKSTDLEDLANFYHRMFVPLMTRKFREVAVLDSYEEMKSAFARGFLLLLEKNSEVVAGALLIPEGKKLVFQRIGVLNGAENLVTEGIQSLVYYHQLRYAVDNGFVSLDTMASAPFLSDGVFRHKAEWGAVSYRRAKEGRIGYLALSRASVQQSEFFRLFPLVIDYAGGLGALVGLEVGTEASDAWFRSLVRRYSLRGLDHLVPLHPESGIGKGVPLSS